MVQKDVTSATTAPRTDIAEMLGVEKTSHPIRRYLKWGGIAAVVVVIAVFFAQWMESGASKTIRYETVDVARGALTITVSATGTLEPVNQVEVGSEISGTIRKVLVDYNDRVTLGQVLTVMETDQFEAKVNKAKAAVETARAKVKQAQATVVETRNKLNRAQELARTGTSSPEERDTAQAAYDRAEAEIAIALAGVAEAQSSLDAEQTTLTKATIHSPINGIVLDRDVEPGQTVAASFQTPVMFVLAEDLTQMELHVDVDEADVGQVKEGQVAEFTVDAYPERSFPATIIEVHFASQTVDGVVTYETVLSVDNSELLLRPGMTATADITVRKIEDALLVPNAALRFNPPVTDAQDESGGDSLISKLMPRPPSPAKQGKTTIAKETQARVWTLRDGQPFAIDVNAGSTDGIMTEITGNGIGPGMALIVDTVSAGK